MTEYRLLTNTEDLPAACEELSRHAALGFDTETTSLDPYAGRLRLIQLAAPDRPVYLFDLNQLAPNGNAAQADSLAPLRELLA
ncbi:MAG: DNA-directed DNA polymerase, partial [Pyrinomonadaceae bacterium]